MDEGAIVNPTLSVNYKLAGEIAQSDGNVISNEKRSLTH